MFLVQNIYFPYNTIKYFEYGQDLAEGSLAEWSKALVLGTSPKGRGFESHRCQHILIAGGVRPLLGAMPSQRARLAEWSKA